MSKKARSGSVLRPWEQACIHASTMKMEFGVRLLIYERCHDELELQRGGDQVIGCEIAHDGTAAHRRAGEGGKLTAPTEVLRNRRLERLIGLRLLSTLECVTLPRAWSHVPPQRRNSVDGDNWSDHPPPRNEAFSAQCAQQNGHHINFLTSRTHLTCHIRRP